MRRFAVSSSGAAKRPLALALVLLVAVALAAIPFAYRGLVGKRKKAGAASEHKQQQSIETQETLAQTITREILVEKNMSPRYGTFIKKIRGLIKAGRIKLAFGTDIGPRDRDFNAMYDSKSNTLTVDLTDISRLNAIDAKAIVLHELFHAYQDYLARPTAKSKVEAEAHLAEIDYLYHQGRPIGNGWFYLVEASTPVAVMLRFNVPLEIIEKTTDASFDSVQYRQAVITIAENYLWSTLFRRLDVASRGFSQYLGRSRLSDGGLGQFRRRALDVLRDRGPAAGGPISIEEILADEDYNTLLFGFVAASQKLMHALYLSGKRTEAVSLWNETFEEFKKALQPADIFQRDVIVELDGIE